MRPLGHGEACDGFDRRGLIPGIDRCYVTRSNRSACAVPERDADASGGVHVPSDMADRSVKAEVQDGRTASACAQAEVVADANMNQPE